MRDGTKAVSGRRAEKLPSLPVRNPVFGREKAMISHRLRMVSAWVALIVATFLVVTAMLTVTLNLRQLKDSFGGVKHTDDVLLQVAEVEANLVAAESAERDFF